MLVRVKLPAQYDGVGSICFSGGLSFCVCVSHAALGVIPYWRSDREGGPGIVSISTSILPQSPLIQTLPWQQKQRRDSTACFLVLLSPGKHPEAAGVSKHR